MPRLTHVERHAAHTELRRELRRRRRERATDLMGYRAGPALGRPSRRERRRIESVRHDRLFFAGLNPSRLLIRRLLRDRHVLRHTEPGFPPMTPIERRDFDFQQTRELSAQGRIWRYGRRCAPGRYGGEYPTVRWPEGIRIHVRFTANRAVEAAHLRARYPYAPLLVFERARFTLRELNAVERRIERDSDALVRQGFRISLLAVDERHNAVEVGIDRPTAAQRAELRRRYGPSVRVVDENVVPA